MFKGTVCTCATVRGKDPCARDFLRKWAFFRHCCQGPRYNPHTLSTPHTVAIIFHLSNIPTRLANIRFCHLAKNI